MRHRTTRGKLLYISGEGGLRREFGRERFSITWHEDGQCTLRAQCEIESGVVAEREVLREVIYTMDKNRRPIDCYNRLHRNGRFLGAGWMRFSDELAECDVVNVELGFVSQKRRLKSPALSLGAHPLSCDAFHLARFNHDLPDRVQKQHDVWMTSLEHDGCSGPLLATIDLAIEYVGREMISVPAGTFETDHYKFHLGGSLPKEHPTEELWCIPKDFCVVKVSVGGYMNATFELSEIEAGP